MSHGYNEGELAYIRSLPRLLGWDREPDRDPEPDPEPTENLCGDAGCRAGPDGCVGCGVITGRGW